MSELERDEISHSLTFSLSYSVEADSDGESRCSRGGVYVGVGGGRTQGKGEQRSNTKPAAELQTAK